MVSRAVHLAGGDVGGWEGCRCEQLRLLASFFTPEPGVDTFTAVVTTLAGYGGAQLIGYLTMLKLSLFFTTLLLLLLLLLSAVFSISRMFLRCCVVATAGTDVEQHVGRYLSSASFGVVIVPPFDVFRWRWHTWFQPFVSLAQSSVVASCT